MLSLRITNLFFLDADTPIVTGRTSVNLGADLDLGCQVTSNPGSVNVNWIKDKETIFDEGTA